MPPLISFIANLLFRILILGLLYLCYSDESLHKRAALYSEWTQLSNEWSFFLKHAAKIKHARQWRTKIVCHFLTAVTSLCKLSTVLLFLPHVSLNTSKLREEEVKVAVRGLLCLRSHRWLLDLDPTSLHASCTPVHIFPQHLETDPPLMLSLYQSVLCCLLQFGICSRDWSCPRESSPYSKLLSEPCVWL